jgi:large subunit ribosomal protein L22
MTADAPQRETAARLRHLRTSPTKVRPVLKLIAGKDVQTARDTLRLCERGVADDIAKLLDSAIANAEHNDNIPEDELFITRAFADEGPTQKRWRPRARGRGTRIRKRTSHITIVVARFEEDELERRRRREAAAGGPARRRPTRRRTPKAEPEHDHDHDHDHDHEDDQDAAEPVKRSAKKSTAKKTAKKSTAEKSTAKKVAKKTTAKKTTAKKAAKRSPADEDQKDA